MVVLSWEGIRFGNGIERAGSETDLRRGQKERNWDCWLEWLGDGEIDRMDEIGTRVIGKRLIENG